MKDVLSLRYITFEILVNQNIYNDIFFIYSQLLT